MKYYCPRGAFYPLLVGGGNYSIGGSSHNRTRTAQTICPPGSYCLGAVPVLCPQGTYGNTPGLSDSSCSGIHPLTYSTHACMSNSLCCCTATAVRTVPSRLLLPRWHGGALALRAYRILHWAGFPVLHLSGRSHHPAALSAREGLLLPRLVTRAVAPTVCNFMLYVNYLST